MERNPGDLFIGETIDDDGKREGTPVLLDSADFTTHGVIVGMTGSGKTGLGVVLLEEALMSGIPVLAIDPKGDLGNLALNFPDLNPADFEPWMDEGTARVERMTIPDMAAKTAKMWRDGLASWDMDGSDIGRLGQAAEPTIFTPGSTSGVPVNALGRLSVPNSDDPSVRQDEVDATVAGLLQLVGVDSDPLSGREHILLANLITRAWDAGTDLDMPTLLTQLMDPPIRKLGVLDLDMFFPPKDRQALALKLNGLLASPSFAAWAEGEPLDMSTLLWKADGTPRAAIMSLGHLDENERHFAITLILSRLISWMRSQSGTGELRVLVYIDEVMGLAPPNGNPAPKKPILTLLKQARAFGVGLVLSTQNPVDLDYKAISNAGTWLIGRLQTEQDKNRLIDGLRAADGAVDVAEVERRISGLGKRQFVLRTTRSSDLPLLTTRWALSYLAGPLTRDQISSLMSGRAATPDTPATAAAPAAGAPAAAAAPAAPAAAAASPAEPAGPTLADDESTVAPSVPDGHDVGFAKASAPWLGEVGAQAGGDRLIPALAARVNLLFDETKADLRHTEEWEAIIPLDGASIDVEKAIAVDFDDRDFSPKAPDDAIYVLPSFNLTKTALKKAQTDLRAGLYADETLELLCNPELKLYSRPGEDAAAFATRCEAAADDGADAAAAKIRQKLESKSDRVQAALAKAEDRVAELEQQKKGRKTQNIIDIGSSLLGGLLGGRRSARSMAGAARRVASGSRQSSSIGARLESAQNRVAEKVEDLEELEVELQDALIEIDDEWSEKAAAVEPFEVPLEKTDITVEDLRLVWLPATR
ncbi:MAG: ATP-binding protein [Acidimicrobiales bacterium]